MKVLELLMTCANVRVTSNIEVRDRNFEVLYIGTFVDMASNDSIFSETVEMFRINENLDKILIYVKR